MSTSITSGLRVLMLEDSALDAELNLRELKRGGMDLVSTRVQTKADFERALGEFGPSLILADFKLPSFNGAQALAIAKHRCPEVPVIIISGAVGEETAVELLKNGATDFVLKDRLGRLLPAVHRALREVGEREARRHAEEELRALNEQLEERITQRTRELGDKNALMEEDLNMARELQMAFLPQHFPTLPRGADEAASAVRFCSIYYPTSSVSGDFFNVVRVSETAVGVFVCDVMGHGVRAALVTAMMRTLEEQLGESAANPGKLLTDMNRALRGILRQLGTTLFTTACYVVVDVASGRLTYANAGHPSPLLVRRDTHEVEPITARRSAGPALGLIENVQYKTQECFVREGDLILAFTDGLFEVENANAEAFNQNRLRELIQRHVALPPPLLVRQVFGEIEHFAGGQAFPDDVCLVGMEIARLDAEAAAEDLFSQPGESSSPMELV